MMGSFLFALFFVAGTGIPMALFVLMGSATTCPPRTKTPLEQGQTIRAFDGGIEVVVSPNVRSVGSRDMRGDQA